MGHTRDLSRHIKDITGDVLLPDFLEKLRSIDPESLPEVKPSGRLGAPITGVGKIIGVGLNYKDHAAESGMDIPKEPVLFLKATSAITGPNDPVEIPAGSEKTDWEVELAVVIGKRAKHVRVDHALKHCAGYLIHNDLSERRNQLERGGTWDKGKGHDTFAPLGPWLVTADEIPNPQNLSLWLQVDCQSMQNSNTSEMIFSVADLISYASRFFTLHPGDIITTGTPAGVGLGQKPPRYLRPGQKIRLGITGLGMQQQQTITAPE